MPLCAKSDTVCTSCNAIIFAGAEVTPIESPVVSGKNGKPKVQWAHSECIDSNDERVPVCNHWERRGMCLYQAVCKFRHPLELLIPNEPRERSRRGARNRHRVLNESRAGELRRWLVDMFGYQYLRSGSGILDVAGGKGELSFELVNLSDIPATVCDPRPLELMRYKKKLHFGFYHNNEILGVYNVLPRPYEFLNFRVPKHLRLYFEIDPEEEVSNTLPVALLTDSSFREELRRSLSTAWTNKGLVHEEEDKGIVDEHEVISSDAVDNSDITTSSALSECIDDMKFSAENEEKCSDGHGNGIISSVKFPDTPVHHISSYDEARSIVDNCSIVVGMHPDQVRHF